jgi:hypothetical protein
MITKKIVKKYLCENCYDIVSVDNTVKYDNIALKNVIFENNYDEITCYCKECNNFTYHFPVDDGMDKVIQLLNKRGFITTNCCAGHAAIGVVPERRKDRIYIYQSVPYITFDKKMLKKKSYIEMINTVIEYTSYKPLEDDIDEKTGSSLRICDKEFMTAVDEIIYMAEKSNCNTLALNKLCEKAEKLAATNVKYLYKILFKYYR